MFFRKLGRKVLLLHSYRDGSGQIRHRRLGHFDHPAAMRPLLTDAEWPRWCKQVEESYPTLRADWPALRRKAELWLATTPEPPAGRARKCGALQTWLRALSAFIQRQPECRQAVAAELRDLLRVCEGREDTTPEALVRSERRNLPSRRRCFDLSDSAGASYRQSLERLAITLPPHEAEGVLAERVRCCPDPAALEKHASCLHALGRYAEARQRLARLPNPDARKHLDMAACWWAEGRHDEAIRAILRGLVRQPDLRRYWQQSASLWDAAGRRFFERLAGMTVVRFSLSRARESNTRPRQLLPDFTHKWLLERLSAPASAPAPPGRVGREVCAKPLE